MRSTILRPLSSMWFSLHATKGNLHRVPGHVDGRIYFRFLHQNRYSFLLPVQTTCVLISGGNNFEILCFMD